MEISLTNRLRRNEQLTRPDGRAKASPTAEVSGTQFQTDRLSLSRQAADYLEAQNRCLVALTRQDGKKPALWEQDEDGGEDAELKALGEHLKTMQKCQKIAARIMRGDKVPPEDEQYLRENDPEGYKLALAMRTPKRNPKKWESVLKDEEQTNEGGRGETTGEASAEAGSASASGEDGAPDSGE